MSSTRAVLQVFEKYQKDRVTFVQTVAELATRPQARSGYSVLFKIRCIQDWEWNL